MIRDEATIFDIATHLLPIAMLCLRADYLFKATERLNELTAAEIVVLTAALDWLAWQTSKVK